MLPPRQNKRTCVRPRYASARATATHSSASCHLCSNGCKGQLQSRARLVRVQQAHKMQRRITIQTRIRVASNCGLEVLLAAHSSNEHRQCELLKLKRDRQRLLSPSLYQHGFDLCSLGSRQGSPLHACCGSRPAGDGINGSCGAALARRIQRKKFLRAGCRPRQEGGQAVLRRRWRERSVRVCLIGVPITVWYSAYKQTYSVYLLFRRTPASRAEHSTAAARNCCGPALRPQVDPGPSRSGQSSIALRSDRQ